MREEALRAVLLIKAIEETDRAGTLIPVAERLAASREARRNVGDPTNSDDGAIEDAALPRRARRMLAARADALVKHVVARHPFVDTLRAAAGGPAWVSLLLVLLGLLFGFMLSALDGTQRINILAPALLTLVLWNLFIYAAVFAGWIRPTAAANSRRRWLAGLIAQNAMARLTGLVAKSASFNAPLAEALRRFNGEWFEAAKPLLVARATRVFHLCAAAVGSGLIAGLYLRGIAFDYQAGWESTFLDSGLVHALLSLLYGPASFVTGIAMPDAAHIEAIRWQNGAGGERAGSWIHLLAASAALFIVLPRLVLALLGTLFVWRWSGKAPMPPELTAYYRASFSGVDSAIGRGIIMVSPYAYEPSADALARLRTLLPSALGENLAVDSRAAVAYGDEESFLRNLGDRGGGIADVIVLLLNLAATPEDENHGTVIAGLRDWLTGNRRHTQLLILVDEGPYAARMAAQGGAEERMTERRRAWREFVAARGLSACVVDLAAAAPPAERTEPADTAVVDQLRSALWQPAAA
jgi:Protein of unknown function (DUF2868)